MKLLNLVNWVRLLMSRERISRNEGPFGPAVASAIKPNILLIDEVLGVGDPNFREIQNKIFAMVKERHCCYRISQLWLMTDVCDRAVLLDRGKIIAG